MNPAALAEWLPPGEMRSEIHAFDARVGGGYRMSLLYPSDTAHVAGKTTAHEDQVLVEFRELIPGALIVEAVTFVTDDAALQGEMGITVRLEPEDEGTRVTMEFSHLPPGLRPEDNDEGARLSLDQLAAWLERR